MRLVLPVFAFLAAATVGTAQENYDLANALAQRGWYDLSTELFTGINLHDLMNRHRTAGVRMRASRS